MTLPLGDVTPPVPELIDRAAAQRTADPDRDAALGSLGPVLDRWAAGLGATTAPAVRRPELVLLTQVPVESVDAVRRDLAALTGVEVVTLGVDPATVDAARLPLSDVPAERPDLLDHEAYHRQIIAGADLADARIDAGADLLIPQPGADADRAAVLTLVSSVTGMEPVEVVGFEYADAPSWSEMVGRVRDLRFQVKRHGGDTAALLTVTGDAVLGGLVGFIARAAVRQVPVLLDGPAATVAAVLAARLAPGADSWCYAARPEPGRVSRRLQDILGVPALGDSGVRAQNGVAALWSVPTLRIAAALSAG